MKFLCDAMLAKLAVWLRIFGFDAELADDKEPDKALLQRARLEKRTLLTRDKKLAEQGAILIHSSDPNEQVREVKQALGLKIPREPVPNHCSKCNGRLVKAGNKWKCEDCSQEFWKGGHWKHIREFSKDLNKVMQEL